MNCEIENEITLGFSSFSASTTKNTPAIDQPGCIGQNHRSWQNRSWKIRNWKIRSSYIGAANSLHLHPNKSIACSQRGARPIRPIASPIHKSISCPIEDTHWIDSGCSFCGCRKHSIGFDQKREEGQGWLQGNILHIYISSASLLFLCSA